MNNTNKLKFFGYSDDTFGEYGITGQDFDNCGSGKPIQCLVDCKEHGRVLIIGQYLQNGCWMAGACKVEGEDIFPDWPISISQSEETPYSVELTVEIPECDFTLEWHG